MPIYLSLKGPHTQAHMNNQHRKEIATTTHRSLVERGGKKPSVRDKGLAHTHTQKRK